MLAASMDNPIVSVVVPVYNVENYLSQCLDSIIRQTYNNLDIVIVNDGSSDRSLEIAESYAADDDRITLIDKCNEGVAATRNVGLLNAHGDYVLFVDSDDWIELDMVEFLLGQAESTGCSIVTCDLVINNNQKSEIVNAYQLESPQIIESFLRHRELKGSLWNKLFRKSVISGLMFDTEVSYGEDALFCWQVFKQFSGRMLMTDRQLYHYRMNNGSISHSFGNLKFTALKVWTIITNDTAILFPGLLPKAQAEFCNQMTMILYDAAINGYKYDRNIQLLQEVVKKYHKLMRTQSKCSVKKYLSAIVLANQYCIFSYISTIVKLIK